MNGTGKKPSISAVAVPRFELTDKADRIVGADPVHPPAERGPVQVVGGE